MLSLYEYVPQDITYIENILGFNFHAQRLGPKFCNTKKFQDVVLMAFVLFFISLRGIGVFEYFCQNELASERVVGQCVLKLLSGLAYLHQLGIVHLSIRVSSR